METEQEFLARIKAGLSSGALTNDEALSMIARYRELTAERAEAPERQQVADQQEPGFWQKAGKISSDISGAINRAALGMGETAMTVGSGMVAEPAAGFAGIGAMIPGGRSPGQAVRETREAMTYQPRTQAGQQAVGELGEVLEPVGSALEAVESGFGEAGYQAAGLIPGASPETRGASGAAFSAIPAAVAEVLGFRGTRGLKKQALKERVAESGVKEILTPEAVSALKGQGFTQSDIDEIVSVDPSQVERMVRFKEQGIQPTKGDITMDTAQRKAEQQLIQTAEGPMAEQMRQLRVGQTQAMRANFEEMIDQYGLPEEVGTSIKQAVKNRRSILKSDATKAYERLAEIQGGADRIPVIMGTFETIPDLPSDRELRAIRRLDKTAYDAMMDALAEFGLTTDSSAMARLANDNVPIDELNIQNFEELRQALSAIRRNDQDGNLTRVLNPLVNELDKQVDVATDALIDSGNPDIAEAAKNARNSWKGYKAEFDPKALTSQMIETKPRSILPMTEVSQVYDKITARSVPVEQVDRLLSSLKAEGGTGNRAVMNMQAAVIADVLDSGFAGSTNKIGDVPTFSGPAMSRRFNDPRFNQKIQAIFKDNPEGYRQLEDLIQTAKDLTPGRLEVVQGSGNVILDIVNNIGLGKLMTSTPLVGGLVEGMQSLSDRSRNRAVFNKAIKANPDLEMASNDLVRSFPMLSAALGIGYISGIDEQEDAE